MLGKLQLMLFTTRCILPNRRFTFLGHKIQWIEKSNIEGIILGQTHKSDQMTNILGNWGTHPLLNKCSGIISKGLVPYKKLIHPMICYACSIWRQIITNHMRKLQALQSKCFLIILASPWYFSNFQLYEDLEVPYLPEYIYVPGILNRVLT